jgi:hypothetical protein
LLSAVTDVLHELPGRQQRGNGRAKSSDPVQCRWNFRVAYSSFGDEDRGRPGHTGENIPMFTWQTIRSSVLGRHSHERAYAAIVFSGGYEEAGDHGRLWAEPGDVVLHERFESHINRFSGSGAVVVLNLPLPDRYSFLPGKASMADPDSLIRIAEKNKAEAAELLLSTVTVRQTGFADWPDELVAALMETLLSAYRSGARAGN